MILINQLWNILLKTASKQYNIENEFIQTKPQLVGSQVTRDSYSSWHHRG